MEALLVHDPSLDWADLLSQVPPEKRLEQRDAVMSAMEKQLRLLIGPNFTIERLDAIGSFCVRGTDLQQVRDALTGNLRVVPDDTFTNQT